MILSVNAYSQNDDSIFGVLTKNKKKTANVTMATKSPMEQYRIYLDKSYKYQYGALGCATAGAGILIGYGCMSDKFELYGGETRMTGKAKGLVIGGSALLLVSAILEINAIQYKMRAGKIRLKSSENGAGFAYVF